MYKVASNLEEAELDSFFLTSLGVLANRFQKRLDFCHGGTS